MFSKAYYEKDRFQFIHDEMIHQKIFKQHVNTFLIPKTGIFENDKFNVYIDTSDGVNEDLEIYEYCGRIKRIISQLNGKPFIFFKSAYSGKWSKKIEEIAIKNNGKIVPFFKWSFNKDFYNYTYRKKEEILQKYSNLEKEYDVGIFFKEKPYLYTKPSEFDNSISWSDHEKFKLPGRSNNTGHYLIESRKDIIEKFKKSKFKFLNIGLSYKEYIEASFKCKVIINPPGIGEYTSRMVDQTFLGNCIVLRKNTYDNGLSWKKHIPEIDFRKKEWEQDLNEIILNLDYHKKMCKEYYEKFWNPKSIVRYFLENIKNE